MTSKKVTILAQIKAKKGMEEELKQESLALVAPSRSELGCINYDLHQVESDKSLLIFYESWVSKEDFEKHQDMPYLKDWYEKVKTLSTGSPEVTWLEIIS